jgi:hypothetical protein
LAGRREALTVGTAIPKAREAIVTNKENASGPDLQPETDLEYDLAHEWTSSPKRPGAASGKPSVYVATEAADRDCDYGYDMAHDVPRL